MTNDGLLFIAPTILVIVAFFAFLTILEAGRMVAKERCLKSGGTWLTKTDQPPYCITSLEELGRKTVRERYR